jgi:hypothetical protein
MKGRVRSGPGWTSARLNSVTSVCEASVGLKEQAVGGTRQVRLRGLLVVFQTDSLSQSAVAKYILRPAAGLTHLMSTLLYGTTAVW